MESCDPGIFPSYFWDFSRAAGQRAWLDIISTHIANGPADGVYDDMRDHLKARFGETVCFAEVKGRQGLLEKLGAMQAAAAAQQPLPRS